MKLTEAFRIDYRENIQKELGPLPPFYGRGHHFYPDEFWPMDSFLKSEGLRFLREKVDRWLATASLRKDFTMPQSGDTPRHMRVVPGTTINKDPEMVALYRDPKLLEFLSGVVGKKVVPYEDELENIVVTALERTGDTHGRHTDVPPLTLLICLEAPPENPSKRLEILDSDGEHWQTVVGTEDGAGMLEFTNAHGDRQVHRMAPTDAYLMRSDLMPHEVLPLAAGSRIILNFTYGIEGMEYKQDGSAQALFAT